MPDSPNMFKSTAMKVIGHVEEPINVGFLSDQIIILPSKYLCAYPLICSTVTLNQRSFLYSK